MRITVNLSLFFHDHRSLAKVYINEEMNCIKDVEHRIKNIFQIDNFYLKCENQYLPPCEDIRVLSYDDIVWAIPVDKAKSEIQTETEEPIKIKKPKKKKKKDEEETASDEQQTNTKRKHKSEENEQSTSELQVKRKKKEKSKLAIVKSEESVFKDSGRDSLDSSKSDDLDNEGKTVSVKTLVNSFEKQKINLKKRMVEFPAMSEKKRINIIKTIIVSDSSKTSNSLEADNSEVSIIESKNEADNSDISMIQVKNETPLNDINVENNVYNKSETLESSCYGNSDFDSIPIKRKRKRVRKRKHVDKEVKEPVYNLIPRPLLTKTESPRHVRFEENVPETDTNTELPNEQTTIHEKTPPNEGISEEFILKQPVTQNILPRQNDIIAFKILRMSENYTPEISSRIVGKVSCYNVEKNEVIFEIMYGLDQCLQPQGKFSLDPEAETTEETPSNKFHCTWPDLLEPRLLFP